jgi:hypothetical protein
MKPMTFGGFNCWMVSELIARSLRIAALKGEPMKWIEGDRPLLDAQYNAQGI